MDKKITIGLFIDSFFPMIDGVTMVVDNYAKRLSKNANVIVFAPKYPGTKYDDSKFGYKVIRCKSIKLPIVDYSMPIPKLDFKFRKQLKKANLDIVHIHSPFGLGKMGIKYAKKNKKYVIGTMHSQFKQDFLRAIKFEPIANYLTKKIIKRFNKCDECWAVNEEVAKIYYNDYKYKTVPRVMNNATDMYLLPNIERVKSIINQKLNIMPDEKVFLFVGRINKLKNIFFIVDSLKILKEKCDFKFKMLFVGNGQDEEGLKKLIKNYNMEDDIIMCGKITDRDLLAYHYARADLFLFPSLYDASSIVQIEAASQKTPTLFIEGAATTGTITKNVNGFISEYDAEKYADNIIEIMKNKELYNKVSENAYEDVYVNWDDKVKEVYDIYLRHINVEE